MVLGGIQLMSTEVASVDVSMAVDCRTHTEERRASTHITRMAFRSSGGTEEAWSRVQSRVICDGEVKER